MPTGDLEGAAANLHVSKVATSVSITLFVTGFGFGPMLFAPLSEFIGRRPVYILTGFLYWSMYHRSSFAHLDERATFWDALLTRSLLNSLHIPLCHRAKLGHLACLPYDFWLGSVCTHDQRRWYAVGCLEGELPPVPFFK